MNDIIWTPGITLDTMEKVVIEKAFIHYQKNKTMTAKSLGISIRTLDAKLERYRDEKAKFDAEMDKRREQEKIQLQRARFGAKAEIPEPPPVFLDAPMPPTVEASMSPHKATSEEIQVMTLKKRK